MGIFVKFALRHEECPERHEFENTTQNHTGRSLCPGGKRLERPVCLGLRYARGWCQLPG